MRFKSTKKGFTLVEEIASIAIISLVLISFLPAFVDAYKNVILSGNRTKNVSEAENKVGNAVQNNNFSSGIKPPETYIIKLKIFSEDGIHSITTSDINGKKIIFDNSGSNKTTLSTFVPNYK